MLSTSIFALLILLRTIEGNTECVWATGRILCNKNQTKVLGSIVEVWDLDSPQNSRLTNPVDPDDKAGFTIVDEESGLFQVEGCASDHDWLPGVINRPEFYLRVHHYCNAKDGEFMTIAPIFRVYTPNTYDYYINHPIVLDTPTPPPLLVGTIGTTSTSTIGNWNNTWDDDVGQD